MEEINYYTALDTYFKLQNKYQNKIIKTKKKIYLDESLTKKEKKNKMSKVIGKCVSCDRNVGSIFMDEDRLYIAKCGDNIKPCKLNIELKKPHSYHIYNLNSLITNNLEEDKLNIIKTKLEYIYGLINNEELDNNFEEVKEQYDNDLRFFDFIINYYKELEERKEGLKELNNELYDNIQSLKNTIREFNKTNNRKYISDSYEYYTNIRDIVKNLRELNYDHMYIEDENNKKYLVQNQVSIENSEINIIPEEVISFVL
jgi:hypothetical protein